MLITIEAIVEAAKTKIAPIIYGIIVFLYSAFSSALPIIYFIPSTTKTTTDTTIPTVVIIPIICCPKVVIPDVWSKVPVNLLGSIGPDGLANTAFAVNSNTCH